MKNLQEGGSRMSRRSFLKLGALTGAGLALAACQGNGTFSYNVDPEDGSLGLSVQTTPWATAEATETPEALPNSIVSLRFQPNADEIKQGITQPTDQPGQTRFVNEYLEAATKATQAPTHNDLDYEYPGKTADTDDLYEAVDGFLQEARDANATIFHGGTGEGMILPTNTASVTWCNATDPNLRMHLAQEMKQLQHDGKFTFAVYTSNGIYHADNLDGFLKDEAGLIDNRSLLFLTKPTDVTLAEAPSVYQTQTLCDHPLGSASVAVR